MNRLEFINALGGRLSQLPPEETKIILDYYVESIDDRVEDGMTEAEAIESFGPLDALAASILREQGQLTVPEAPAPPEDAIPTVVYREKRPIRWWVVVLLVLGSPVWLGLGAGVLGILLGVYVTAWSLLAALWAVAVTFAVCGVAGAVMSFFAPVSPNTIRVRVYGCGMLLALAGLGLMLIPGCLWLTRGFCRLHRRVWRWTKRKFHAWKEGRR